MSDNFDPTNYDEALDYCDYDEDMASALLTIHAESGNRYLSDTWATVGDTLCEGYCH